jgi:hypothetical protein
MAKAKKRATQSSARGKTVQKKSSGAKKSAAKPAVAPAKKAAKKGAPKSKPSTVKKVPVIKSTVKAASKPIEHVAAKTQRPEPPPKKTEMPKNVAPDAKKKLAAQHMWDLVQAKKQRLAQTPAWQTIEHHDHPAPRTSPDLSSEHGGTSTPTQIPGHRDRGTG